MFGFSENFCQHLKLLSLEERLFYGLKATGIIGSKKFETISHLVMERETSLQQQPKRPPSSLGSWWMTPFGFGINAQCTHILWVMCSSGLHIPCRAQWHSRKGKEMGYLPRRSSNSWDCSIWEEGKEHRFKSQSQQVKLIWTISSHGFTVRELLIKHDGLWF